MKPTPTASRATLHRRDFLTVLGAAGAVASGKGAAFSALVASPQETETKSPAKIYGAFVYPPTEQLDREGYYSWPGSSFDAEGRQQSYLARLQESEAKLGLQLWMAEDPIDQTEQADRFIAKVKQDPPDGLLLIPFKKGHWPHVTRIIEETGVPTVVLATMGVLLVPHVREIYRQPGVYMINSLDNLDAVAYGLRMLRTRKRMQQSCILNIQDAAREDTRVPHLGTKVRTIPRSRFVAEFDKLQDSAAAQRRADEYLRQCEQILEPSRQDVRDAAKTYFVLKALIEQEQADAMMMECLPGLKRPHLHVPPCMGFMDLRDEGIPAGCEADLDATLTMMLIQHLFDRPAFQHNPSVDTEKNLYFGAHCTCATRMHGIQGNGAAYVLRNHAEAGWGCVPEVIFEPDQEITIAKYLVHAEQPSMILYTGKILYSPRDAHIGGCRTKMLTTINELDDICQLQGHHLCMCYGDWGVKMKAFNQLCRIETIT